MPKQGMKRPEDTHTKQKNSAPPVPEIQGKAKSGKIHANPIIAPADTPLKVYHDTPHNIEKPVSNAYGIYDTDLARDNADNDKPEADLP